MVNNLKRKIAQKNVKLTIHSNVLVHRLHRDCTATARRLHVWVWCYCRMSWILNNAPNRTSEREENHEWITREYTTSWRPFDFTTPHVHSTTLHNFKFKLYGNFRILTIVSWGLLWQLSNSSLKFLGKFKI